LKKEYYNSIEDLPIWNWWKIAETGNLIYLYKEDNYTKEDYKLYKVWNDIQDEYLDEFGITNEFREVLSLKKKWIEKRTEYVISQDRFIKMESDLLQIDINDLINEKKSVDKEETLIMLEQKLGIRLDAKNISVKKYYKYINYFSKNG